MTLPAKKDPTDPANWCELLPAMEGKVYLIMGTAERILHHEVGEEKVMIKTDKRTRNIDLDDLQKFLIGVVPAGEAKTFDHSHSLAVVEDDTSSNLKVIFEQSGMSKITDKLMEVMNKVDTDATYVRQAHAINNLAKTAMNIANLQIQMLKKHKQ